MKNSENRYGYPSGQEGEEMLDEMNECHTPTALWALTNIDFKEDDLTLDIGCGGGINIQRVHEKSPKAKSYGVDYSATSVKKSKLFNKELVDSGKVEIYEANVINMPFEDNMFDVITAFETVYFWPNLEKAFNEVKRILKPCGKFFMELGSNNEDYEIDLEEDPKMEGFSPLNDEKLRTILQKVGFSRITIYLRNTDENKKMIKTYIKGEYTKEIINDDFDYSQFNIEDSESKQSLCVIAEK